MHIGGRNVIAKVRRRAARVVRTPAFGVIVIAPAVLIGAVGAAAPAPKHTVSADGYMPLAAVARGADDSGVRVIAAAKPIKPLRIAAANPSPPPPPIVFSTMGNMRIPVMALNAYRNAERMMASAYPGCGVSWNLLAGIGRIESLHANGGATDARGTPIQPIYGPTLDGTLAGNEVIVQSVQSGRVTYARAMGPMQFLPGTWARYASDGDNDGKADVQNLFDSTLAAARYLCSGNLNLRDQSQVLSAILRYNNSMAYARNVLGWAAAYQTGVEPVDLPVIGGAPPPISDVHLTTTRGEGLGPGLPPNATGLPATDPLAVTPLFDIGGTNAAGTIGAPAAAPGPLNPGAVAPGGAPAPATPQQNCQVFCIQGTPAPPPAAVPPPAPAPFAPPLFGPPNPVPAAPFAPPPPPPAPGGLPAEAAPVVPPGPLGQQPGPPPA